jgi:hypothetical protein
MIEIAAEPWQVMVAHAEQTYPKECCGAMLGHSDGERKTVTEAVALANAFAGEQGARYELRPEDLLEADRQARAKGLDLIGNTGQSFGGMVSIIGLLYAGANPANQVYELESTGRAVFISNETGPGINGSFGALPLL